YLTQASRQWLDLSFSYLPYQLVIKIPELLRRIRKKTLSAVAMRRAGFFEIESGLLLYMIFTLMLVNVDETLFSLHDQQIIRSRIEQAFEEKTSAEWQNGGNYLSPSGATMQIKPTRDSQILQDAILIKKCPSLTP
ncbi:MAG: hypothetical protein WBS20_09770, partial [Lysobacterales bacterium]